MPPATEPGAVSLLEIRVVTPLSAATTGTIGGLDRVLTTSTAPARNRPVGRRPTTDVAPFGTAR